jgi:hypothetical protein
MPIPIIYAGYAVATTAGRIALPVLAKEFAKRGGTKFIKTYGKSAFQAVTGGTAGAVTYDQINKSVAETGLGLDIGDKGEKEKERARIAEENKELMKGSTQPKIKEWQGSFPDQSGEIADSSPPPSTPRPIELPQESFPDLSEEANKPQVFFSKEDDVKKQTDKLVPEKVELGPLSAVEKQTAIALKGDKPDYYSRAVEAITNAKQDKSTKGKWKSIIQSNSTKEEMNYLGLTEFLQGNESATKEELLKLVKDKNIAPDLVLTKIPKGGQQDFSTFSIGGAGNTTGQYAIQITKDFDAESLSSSGIDMAEESEFGLSKKIYQATGAHLKEEYGRNTMAHARTQIGYNPTGDYVGFADLPEDSQIKETVTSVKQNASQELKNTFIVDEIQSDWIQDIQKFGTKEDFIIKKGSDIDSEFINKRYGTKYQLKTSKFSTMKQTLEETGLQYNKVLYVTDRTTGIGTVLTNIDSDKYYTFSKTRITGASGFKTKEDAQKNAETKGINNLPITESKKYVELMLNSLIKEAVLNGTDSIGITNGQIQGDRYEGQGDAESDGLKKFYDNIVIPQLEKIAEQYGVKDQVERVTISEPEFSEDDDIKSIPNRMKMSMQNGFVLRTVRADLLYATLNDRELKIPDYFTIYSNSGRAQGSDRIMDVLENDDSAANRVRNPKDYFIWVKKDTLLDSTLNRQDEVSSLKDFMFKSFIDFSMPITIANPGNNLTTPEDDASEGTTNMTNYSSYILDYKNKGIDLSYEHDEHQIIKMPLPKKLQKDILSKPIKLSKLKTQSNRLTA